MVQVRVFLGDLTLFTGVEAVINAANGQGIMGAGVTGALARAAGSHFQAHVKKYATANSGYTAGQAYTTASGLLAKHGVLYVIHAVTMTFPGGPTSIQLCQQALLSTFEECKKFGITKIALPALGTGIGKLNKKEVAEMMINTVKEHAGTYGIELVCFVDYDSTFTSAIQERSRNS